MPQKRRSEIALGVLFILAGGWMLLTNLVPDVKTLLGPWLEWPLSLVIIGAVLFLFGLITDNFGLFIPASILAVLGGIFYWQAKTDNYESWSYAWTLIIGAIGLGTLLQGVFKANREQIIGGLNTLLVSFILFAVFGTLLGRLDLLGPYWPLLLIGLGLILLLQALWPRRGQ